jgi:serine/threonine protein kinase
MESSVKLKGFTPDFWMPTQNQVFLLGIASRMAFMHVDRFIRRGLKPANVLLYRARRPRIGRFGPSKSIERMATLSRSMQAGAPVHGAGDLRGRLLRLQG